MRVGCEKYGTSVMKEDEVLLFLDVTIADNNQDVKDAIADMKMIDTMLYAFRLQIIASAMTKITKAGHHRKGSDLYTTLNRIVDGRLTNAF